MSSSSPIFATRRIQKNGIFFLISQSGVLARTNLLEDVGRLNKSSQHGSLILRSIREGCLEPYSRGAEVMHSYTLTTQTD